MEKLKLSSYKIDEIAYDYFRYYKTKDDEYLDAIDLWWDLETIEERFEYLIAILDQAPIDDTNYLFYIGAGPLEDLTEHENLDFIAELRKRNIGRDSEIDKKLCVAYQGYRFAEDHEPLTDEEKEIIEYVRYHYPTFSPIVAIKNN